MSNYHSTDWANAALLTIDVQQDFTLPGAPVEILGTVDAVSVMRSLTESFRCWCKPIIHVVRFYRPDASNVYLCRRYDVERGECW